MKLTDELDPDQAALKRALNIVAEHYDNVVILANRHDPKTNQTETIAGAFGNTFALTAHAAKWVDDQTQPDPPDDDDDEAEAWKGN